MSSTAIRPSCCFRQRWSRDSTTILPIQIPWGGLSVCRFRRNGRPMFTRYLLLSLSLACLTLVTHRAGADNGGVTPRPFAVADGVAMRMLTAPSSDLPPAEVDQWSSDRKHFFAVTSRGDISRNQMISELWLFTKV